MTTVAFTAATERAASLLGDLARRDEPLGARTTYRVGGNAALFCRIEDEHQLGVLARAVAASGVEVLVLGKGSNLLVADRGFDGLVVVLAGSFEGFSALPAEDAVDAGAALALPVLARRAAGEGLVGLEWAVGVPGSVGGAIAMNAGGHGSDTASCLRTARVLHLDTEEEEVLTAADLAFSYRHSRVGPRDLVLGARFAVRSGDATAAGREIEEIVRWRREHQPGGRNAGSVFTNPPGDSAGRLIDASGLKGLRVGSAEVSEKHANFIQLDADGSADDVRRLIDEVRRLVAARTGVELHEEVRYVGFAS